MYIKSALDERFFLYIYSFIENNYLIKVYIVFT